MGSEPGLLEIDRAFAAFDRTVTGGGTEEVPLREALWRVTADPVAAPVDLPPFDQSAMDGWALRSEETAAASREDPVRLRVAGRSRAGAGDAAPEVRAGEAVRIFTGGRLPPGADAVLRQEDAEPAEDGRAVLILRPAAAGEAVRRRGEETAAGTELVPAGERLAPGHVGAVAVAGVGRLRVRRRPGVSVLVTGDELVPPGESLGAGQVYEGNGSLLRAWLQGRGVDPVAVGRVPDDPDATARALEGALDRAELVLTTGGASVGEHDHVLDAARRVGVERVFWRVRQKPGKPLFFGVRDGRAVLGLPGNPGSAFVCAVTHGARVLDLLEGVAAPGPRFRTGRLAGALRPNPVRESWVRCRTEPEPGGVTGLRVLPGQASHMLGNLVWCDALARVPAGEKPLPAGTPVPWVACGPGPG